MTRRWVGRLLAGLAALAVLALGVALLLDTAPGHRWVAGRVDGIRTANGLRFHVGRIGGSLYGRAELRDVRVYDTRGLFLRVPEATLDWRPLNWARNRLDVRALLVPQATLLRAPATRPTGRKGPVLPSFDIAIGRLAVDRLDLAPPVLGRARRGSIRGRADIRSGRAAIVLDAAVEGSDRLLVRLDAEPGRDRFDLDVRAEGAAGGVLSRVAGAGRPVALDVGGAGSWTRWRGRALARAGQVSVADLSLAADRGRYALSGVARPSELVGGKLERLTAPRVLVSGGARLDRRVLDGALSLRSPALALDAAGVVDLGTRAFRGVKLRAALLRPPALFPNMTGRAIGLRAVVGGPVASPRIDYRLAADRFAFDDTGFEQARAAGVVQVGGSPQPIPVRFAAARVTGVGDVAGGILRNLALDGRLMLGGGVLTGDALRLRSDKLSGAVDLRLDLATGRYEVGLNGGLNRYLIPGLGVVDVRSRLQVAPGPGGRGARVVGRGTAEVRRLDNGFFRGLAGGLPRIDTGLERGADGVVYFRGLRLTAPALRLAGEGYRRRDGTFHFEGSGTQARYGPVVLRLDGRIDRPTVDLLLARPQPALGLSAVRARLDPTPQGFAFRAAGGSRLGPFQAAGAILLPRGADAVIRVAALNVAGARASGDVRAAAGGFDGRLAVAGAAAGELLFRPVGDVQRIEAHLAARGLRVGPTSLRAGRLDWALTLDPAGLGVDGAVRGQGLRRGALGLARFAVDARLRGGVGQVRASVAGSRGRAFELQALAQVSPDRLVVGAQGSLDRRPIRLLTPAVLARGEGGWRLAPTRLGFAGGELRASGGLTAAGLSLDVGATRLPLAILDVASPDLGLSGAASGSLSVLLPAAGAPTGRVSVTIRGLSRAGLVLSSQPIDLALAGVLSADRLGARAVMASNGRTIGRGQALLRLGAGPLAQRVSNATLFAQLRYAGPADTLWRLSGVELFDLSGPVAVGADVSGRVLSPVIRGAVQANGARIESATTGTVLTDVRATGRFDGARLVVDRFGAQAGPDGRVEGAGAFDFAVPQGIGLDLRLQATHARMIARDDIAATVTGPLRFRSPGRGGVITGDVTLDRSRYRLGRATAAAAAPRLNIREVNVPGAAQPEEDDAPPAPWLLQVRARAPNAVRVSGLGLSSEWSADLTIGGRPDNPAITGQAELIRGDVAFAGREFQLSRGVIRFGGEAPANPALDISADATTSGLNATIRVTGTALKPEIDFTSTPALPEDELLSRLLFGTSITNLSAPEALQLASAVAALQNGGGGLDPINAVRRAAGLDRLRFLPADPQTGQGTAVAAGKYVTRRLYAEIVTDGQGYSATQVEFQVTRWLSLLSSISTLGRQSANVRVSTDY